MAHELTVRSDGTVEMAYLTGVDRWHGLGNELAPGASIAEWQTAAGMDWKILRSIVRYNVERGGESDGANFLEMADKRVLFRSDTKAALGLVSASYKPMQPGAVLEFFRELVHLGGFELTTAGTLFGGRRFWALAQIGDDAYVADPRDKVKGNLLLCTSADGTLATEGRFVNTCVVCNNTLTAARSEKDGTRAKVNHRSVFDSDGIKKQLGVARTQFESTMDSFRMLANTGLDNRRMAELTCELFNPDSATLARDALRKLAESKPVERIAELAMGGGQMGGDLAGRKGTAWAWLNAVTQYVDHEARARNVDNRVNSAWFGKGDSLKTRAYEMAVLAADGTEMTRTEYRTEESPPDDDGNDFARLMGRA